jgi:hypothetical protein
MDARAFAAPKRLRPRRRVKPAHDELWWLTVARMRRGDGTIVYLQPMAEALSLAI